jgi:enoyl-CoA hydratase/carnithine racemase
MFTDTSEYDAQGKDVVQDLVRLNLVLPRSCLENGTIDMLREAGRHSEEELRMIGLVEHLVERHGHHYGAGLIYALHFSMDIADHENSLGALMNQVQELIEAYSRPYVPDAA